MVEDSAEVTPLLPCPFRGGKADFAARFDRRSMPRKIRLWLARRFLLWAARDVTTTSQCFVEPDPMFPWANLSKGNSVLISSSELVGVMETALRLEQSGNAGSPRGGPHPTL